MMLAAPAMIRAIHFLAHMADTYARNRQPGSFMLLPDGAC